MLMNTYIFRADKLVHELDENNLQMSKYKLKSEYPICLSRVALMMLVDLKLTSGSSVHEVIG